MKCHKCKKIKAAVELKYSKQFLCGPCFIKLFENRVRKTIRRGKLLDPADKIAVALSGGKDSMTVLHILKKLSERAPKSELFAISIDEGIAGRTWNAARSLCKQLRIEHRIFSFKDELGTDMDEIVKKMHESGSPKLPCSYCGVFRRDLLNRKARELGATKLATGHNLDDEVQTALMNFIRGDLERIARSGSEIGIIKDEKFIPRIKPLRECPEQEVALYSALNKFDVHLSGCPYSAYAFRGTIRDAIDEIESKHPGSKFQILSTMDELIPILKKEYKSKAFLKPAYCKICGELTSGEICKSCEFKKLLGI
ncbi:MAG: TIGR00269 family protein [Candidatus Altiarchaeales archaeon WOR_SM1_86-2]|nr:MAG: TIGR00269 family protein [Candidatus Altiarchaeales archaeon WOR_SM1_86-2]ODS39764.1 MAG: TIGR00269 family protein [Candidatus Altiarchaeales archaeon WOR_SM1_79]